MVTWTKLKSGDWGLRGTELRVGAAVTVTKKTGETKTVTVGRILWSGDDGTMLATVASAGRRRSRGGCGCPCGDCSPCLCDSTCNCRGGNIYNC